MGSLARSDYSVYLQCNSLVKCPVILKLLSLNLPTMSGRVRVKLFYSFSRQFVTFPGRLIFIPPKCPPCGEELYFILVRTNPRYIHVGP